MLLPVPWPTCCFLPKTGRRPGGRQSLRPEALFSHLPVLPDSLFPIPPQEEEETVLCAVIWEALPGAWAGRRLRLPSPAGHHQLLLPPSSFPISHASYPLSSNFILFAFLAFLPLCLFLPFPPHTPLPYTHTHIIISNKSYHGLHMDGGWRMEEMRMEMRERLGWNLEHRQQCST